MIGKWLKRITVVNREAEIEWDKGNKAIFIRYFVYKRLEWFFNHQVF
jgi:hypothetical protein